MITEYMKDTATAIVAALNARIPEYETAYKLFNAIYRSRSPMFDDPSWHNADWAREIDVDGVKWDITKYKMEFSRHTKTDISYYFVMQFMGGDIAIGLTGEVYEGEDYWDNEISYGLVKYQPYYSKGLK